MKVLESAFKFSRFIEGGSMFAVYLVITTVFFAVTAALVYACEVLRGQS